MKKSNIYFFRCLLDYNNDNLLGKGSVLEPKWFKY